MDGGCRTERERWAMRMAMGQIRGDDKREGGGTALERTRRQRKRGRRTQKTN